MVSASTVPKVSLRSRSCELEAIATLLDNAAAGRGGALVLRGDAGLGKTALLRHAIAEAAGFTVLVTAGTEAESTVPYAGLHRLLDALLGEVAGPAGRGLPGQGPHLSPVLRRVLSGDGCPPSDRLALCVAVLDLLRAMARHGQVLCCVDDAHWLDRPSGDVLTFAARRLGAHRVVMLFASREHCPGLPVTRLDGLDQRGSLEVLADLVPAGLAGDVAAVLAAMAGGNPRALVELAGALTPEQRRGEAPPPAALPVEGELRRSYRERLNRLPAGTRWLLLLIAADEALTAVELVAAAQASGHDPTELEPAEAAGLVHLGGDPVTFANPLLRSVVYHEATIAGRRAAHLVLACTLETAGQRLRHLRHRAAVAGAPDAALADELAEAATGEREHTRASLALERAAVLTPEPERASLRRIAAAQRAWLGGQPHRARMLLRSVPSDLVPEDLRARSDLLLGEIELRSGATTNARSTLLSAAQQLIGRDRHLAVGALMLAGEALCLAGDHTGYAAVARQALELRHPDEPLDAELMFEHFSGLAATFTGNHREAVLPLRRVLELAPRLDDAVALVRAGTAGIMLGDGARARQLAVRAVTVARSAGEASVVPQALRLLATADFALGSYDTAVDAGLEGLRLAWETGQERLAHNALAKLAILAGLIGDWSTCQARVRRARAGAGGDQDGQAWALCEWASALLELNDGHAGGALGRLRSLVTTQTGRGDLVVQIAATPHLVEAAVRTGAGQRARAALRVFDLWAGNTGNPTWLALSHRCHALLAERDCDAEEHFGEALRLHAMADSELIRARTEQLYGQELRRRRRPAAARQHLRSALETYQRFDAQWWAEQTSAELRAAGEHVKPRCMAANEALTAQQLQIARLVADGATNREVAAQMFLSPRTVDHHMRNIFTRLGIRSRTELVKLMG